jgi:DNA primase
MAFPDSFVEEVRRTADIVRLISDHVALKKMGTSWKGLCPFHQEKTPSFNVRSEPAVFHCFGCGEGGDVFKFVMLHERVGFPEALETVARRFGVPIPEQRSWEAGPDRKEREDLFALLEAAAEHFTRSLWTAPGTRAREHLLGRGFKKDTLERIRAGAAPDSWSDLLDAMKRRFPEQALVTAGLVVPRQDKSGHYDRFRNRAVFPILNESGRVVAFGARSLDGSEPKYLNSPETPVYQKSRTLYGLSWAKDAARREGRLLLMEGYLDVARALEHGFDEAVATCGTSLTSGHARLLRRFGERVLVSFDQDDAGQKAARKSFEVLSEESLRVQVVTLSEGHDPDTFLKQFGAEAFRERIAQAPEFMDWLMERAASEHDLAAPAGKAAYLNALLPALVRIENAVEQAAWLPRLAARAGIDPAAAQRELKRALAGRPVIPTAPAAPASTPKPARTALLPAEKWLLALILKGAPGVEDALGELRDSDFDRLASAELLRAAKAVYLRNERLSAASLEAGLGSEDARRMLREIAMEDTPVDAASPQGCVDELRRRVVKARLAEIQRELPVASGASLDALLQEKNALSIQIMER